MLGLDGQSFVIAHISDQWYLQSGSDVYTTASLPLREMVISAGMNPDHVHWLLFGRTPRGPEDISSMYRVEGLVELLGPKNAIRGPIGYVLGLPQYVKGLVRCFRDADVMIVKSNYVAAWIALVLDKVMTRRGLLVTMQVGDPEQALRHAHKRYYSLFSGIAATLTSRTNAAADLRLFVSKALALKYGKGADGCRVVNESRISVADIVPEPKTLPKTSPFRVLFVGRLSPEKGIEDLLKAIAEARLSRDVTLTIVGDGDQAEALKRVADPGIVSFVGRVRWGPELFSIMRQHHILVLPSLTEGLGLVLIEAMSQGTPVIGTHVGGIPGLIVDGVSGLLVPPQDHMALAGAIERLASDEMLYVRLSLAGLRVASENTLAQQMGAVLRESVQSILDKRRTSSASVGD